MTTADALADDGNPDTAVGPAADDTEMLDTAATPDTGQALAWTDTDPDDDESPRHYRGHRLRWAIAVTAASVALVAVVWLSGVFYQSTRPAPPAPATRPTAGSPAPASAPPTTPFPPAPAPTVTLAAPPPVTITAAPPLPAAPPTRMPPPAAVLDQEFLNDVTAAGLPVLDARLAVAGGRDVCAYLASGHSEGDAAAMAMRNNPSLGPGDARTVVGTAVRVYCPEQAD